MRRLVQLSIYQSVLIILGSVSLFHVVRSQTFPPLPITKNFGPLNRLPGTKILRHQPKSNPPPEYSFLRRGAFTNSLESIGSAISVKTKLKPGIYEVTLGFIQSTRCSPGTDVFLLQINGKTKLQSFDIYAAASRTCSKPLVISFSHQALTSGSFQLTLISIVGKASIAYLDIRPPKYTCESVNKKGLPNHLAHAVPGIYTTFTDWKGVGTYPVFLNGKGSHSHFTRNGRNSRIISFVWTIAATGQVISKKSAFTYEFPVGTTLVSLAVVDEICDRHVAQTTISVTTTVQPGAYCYFYQYSRQFLQKESLFSGPVRPFFSALSPTSNFQLTHPLAMAPNRKFLTRCLFFIKFDKKNNMPTTFFVSTYNTGVARLYSAAGLLLDTSSSRTSKKISIPSGLASFEIIYRRDKTSTPPKLLLSVSGTKPDLYYDQSSILPIIQSITPKTGSLRGGNTVAISGVGLYWPLKIFFGSLRGQPEWRGSSSKRLFVKTPSSQRERIVDVFVQAKPGIESNSLKFNFSDACDAVAFKKVMIKLPRNYNIPLATSIIYGNDGKLYISSAEGKVYALEYDAIKMSIKSICSSKLFQDPRYRRNNGQFAPRNILGMTLDPRDKVPRPYVSVGTMEWPHTISPSNPHRRWSNGAVVRLVSTKPKNGICLKYDRHIVRNLPVSPKDHGVNSMVFNQRGDLLISLGGHTNAGLPAREMGGVWESYFSASVIVARLTKKNFNGDIAYINPNNPRIARPRSSYTDVVLYATGLRNLFSLTMLRNGRIVGVDMGANCGQGNVSSSCSEYNENSLRRGASQGTHRSIGQVVVDRDQKKCMYGPSRTDKLVEIKQGKFYGHSNLQRGGTECKWIDPNTNQPPGPNLRAPANYEKPMSMVFSAKTGVREYGANLFCGELRNDLLLSQYSEQGTWRVRLSKDGNVVDEPYDFIKRYSGIALEETAHGDLLFARFKFKGIFSSKADVKESRRKGLFVINALPFRHGRKGGSRITIGGWGFGKGMRVLIGRRPCVVIQKKLSAREVVCIVPSGIGLKGPQELVVQRNGRNSVLSKAVLYMLA